MIYVSTCLRVNVIYVPTCQKRAKFSFLHTNEPINVPTCHTVEQYFKLPIYVPIFETFLSQNIERNFYNLLLSKKIYSLLYIIVENMHMFILCICIVHKNYTSLYFMHYTSFHINMHFIYFMSY